MLPLLLLPVSVRWSRAAGGVTFWAAQNHRPDLGSRRAAARRQGLVYTSVSMTVSAECLMLEDLCVKTAEGEKFGGRGAAKHRGDQCFPEATQQQGGPQICGLTPCAPPAADLCLKLLLRGSSGEDSKICGRL